VKNSRTRFAAFSVGVKNGRLAINFESLVSRAVIDNTAFSGLMRLYAPELPEHQEFNRQIDGGR